MFIDPYGNPTDNYMISRTNTKTIKWHMDNPELEKILVEHEKSCPKASKTGKKYH